MPLSSSICFAATGFVVASISLMTACSSQQAGLKGSGDDELDTLEVHYEENSRQVVERDHFEVLNSPDMVLAKAATSVEDEEHVLGVYLGGEAMAYPIGALGSSELVNDVCGGIPITASW